MTNLKTSPPTHPFPRDPANPHPAPPTHPWPGDPQAPRPAPTPVPGPEPERPPPSPPLRDSREGCGHGYSAERSRPAQPDAGAGRSDPASPSQRH